MAEYVLGRIKFVYQGTWTTGTTYVVDDVVTVGGKTWICVISHTASALFATDQTANPSKWSLVADGQTWRGTWTTSTLYNIGDLVKYYGIVYQCNTSHTSASTSALGLEANQSSWDQFATGFNYRSAWTTSTQYHVGDLVTYGGYVYYCITYHTSASTSTLGLENDSAKWQTFNAGITYLGAFAASTRYRLNDVVKAGADLYICISAHTSGSTIDSTGTLFALFVNGFEFVNSWNSSTTYYVGDVVTYGGYSYVAILQGSNQTPSTANTYWTPITTGFSFQGDWLNTTTYKIGSVVRLHAYTYLAIADTVTFSPTITATTVTTNLITVASTTGYVAGMAVTPATSVGNLVGGQTYYLLSGFSATQFQVSLVPGGTAVTLATTTGQTVSTVVAPQPGTTASTYWSRLNQGLAWINSSQSYTNVASTAVTGVGSGATFNVTRSNSVYTVTLGGSGGTNYVAGNTVKVLGTAVGGLSPVNDITITVSTLSGTAIATFTSTGIAVTWNTGVNYLVGDNVLFGANSYICVQAHYSISGNRPDNDTTAAYWNVIAAGAEVATLTTAGDTFYYGPNGPTRLPIGTDGQVLRATNGYPAWANYGVINNVVYVGPNGTDSPAPSNGLTIDKPWKTLRYAARQVENGYLYPNAQYLVAVNKQFMMKEISNYVAYTYQATVTASNSTGNLFTAGSTSGLLVGMPIAFSGTTVTTTATSASGTSITVGLTTNMTVGMPVYFGTSFGTIVAGTRYYVQAASGTTLTVSATQGGGAFTVGTVPSTSSTVTVGGAIGGGNITTGTTYYVQSIASPTTFTVSTSLGGTAITVITETASTWTVKAALVYGYAKCERDTGLILDAVLFDLGHGGTLKTTTAALSYYTSAGNAYITSNFGTQAVETAAAFTYLRTLIGNVIANTAPSSNYQSLNGAATTAYQQTNSSYTAETGSSTVLTGLMNIVINGLTAGTSQAIPPALSPNTTISVKTGSYIEALPINLPSNTAIVGDELRSTTIQPITTPTLLVNDKPKYLASIARIKSIIPNLLQNSAVGQTSTNTSAQVTSLTAGDVGSYSNPTLVATATTAGSPGVITVSSTTNLTPGTPVVFANTFGGITGGTTYYVYTVPNSTSFSITAATPVNNSSSAVTLTNTSTQTQSFTYGVSAVNSVIANGQSIYSIINNGLGSVPSFVIPWVNNNYNTSAFTNAAYATTTGSNATGITTAYGNGAYQIAQNYAFIKADLQQYLSNNYNSVWTALGSTGQSAVATQVGYVLDALQYDLTYGGNTQSLIAGSAYYAYFSFAIQATGVTTTQMKAAYAAMYGYLKTTHFSTTGTGIILGAAITKQVGNAQNQVVSGNTGNAAASGFAQDRVQNIINWINNGTADATIAPYTASALTALQTSLSNIQAQRSNIATDTSGWVQKYFQSLTFNIATCQRDTGYIVDALGYDVALNSNFASVIAARRYYTYLAGFTDSSAQTVINNQLAATVGAFNFTLYKVKNIAASGSTALVQTIIDDMTNTINGTAANSGQTVQVNGTVTYNNTLTTVQGAEIIRINKSFLTNEILAYLGSTTASTSATATAVSTNLITVTSVNGLAINAPIVFSGTTFGGITAGTVYYVQTIASSTTITVSASAGSPTAVTLSNATGTMTLTGGGAYGATVTTSNATGNVFTTASAHNLVVGDPVTFTAPTFSSSITATSATGNTVSIGTTVGLTVGSPLVVAGTTIGNLSAGTYYVLTIPSATTITVSSTYNGSAVTQSNATGTMTASGNAAFGGVNYTTQYYVYSTPLTTTFTVSASPTFSITATATAATTNLVTVSNMTGLTVGMTVTFSTGSNFGNLTTATTYYITAITSTGTNNLLGTLTLSTSLGGTAVTLTTATGTLTGVASSGTQVTATSANGLMTVGYTLSSQYTSFVQELVDGLVYDLQYTGNYRSLRALTYYQNYQAGSILSNMFLVRNASGLRNCTLVGLSGSLGAANTYGTKRPTAGAYVALDPGFGPYDSNAWVINKSHYSQNVTMFGTGCVGAKIDGALHAGGNRSMVKNDFTTVLSDGIGVWVTGSNSLTELVSVFSYYGYAGYLAELGGKIRATNGNSSYGTYGVVAEGVDSYETPITASLYNRANPAYITNTVTDAKNQVYRIEYANAGSAYSNATFTINGSGYNAAAVGDEFRDAAVFETRLIDLNDGNGFGGAGYLTIANTGQGGDPTFIKIAAADTGLSQTYVGMQIQLTAGTGVGQVGYIVNYNSGSKNAYVAKNSFTATVTATQTFASGNLINVTGTANLYVGMPIYFTGTSAGGITCTSGSAVQIYYVLTVTSTQITISLTSGGSAVTLTNQTSNMGIIAAGWDHIVPGTAIIQASPGLDLTTAYIIEPRIQYTGPGFASTARTLPATATWKAVTYALNSYYVAVASGSTSSAYSVDGKTWSTAGLLTASTAWTDIAFGGGSGATATATVGGVGGIGASLTAVLGTGALAGQVVSVTVNSGGTGYTTAPTLVFGSGTATATATVLNGAITAVTVVIPGAGYGSAPTVTARTDIVTAVTPVQWGRNYTSAPSATIQDPFSGTAWSSGGTATLNTLYYYVNTTTQVKTWYIATSGGTFATGAANGPVTTGTPGVTTTTNGSVSLTFIGTTAQATTNLNNQGVYSYTITTAGAGYGYSNGTTVTSTVTSPTVTIVDANAKYVAISNTATTTNYQTAAGALAASAWTAGSTGLPATGFNSITFGVVSGQPTWVAVGNTSGAAISVDGSSFTAKTLITASGNYTAVGYGNGYFIAIATGGTTTSVSSSGGASWSAGGALPASTTWTSIAYGNGRWVALAASGYVAYSIDGAGATWTAVPNAVGTATSILSSSLTWTQVRYGQGLFMAIASGTTVCATSPDGINWTLQAMQSSSAWTGLTFGSNNGNPLWVSVSNTSGTIAQSMHTGTTPQGRIKVASGAISEIRMIEPGSGFPKGAITTSYAPVTMVVNSSSGNNITVASSISGVVANQPITFASAVGSLSASPTVYYVVSASGTTLTVSATVGGSATSVGSTTGLTVNATTQSIVVVDNTENLVANQPVEFQGATAAGLTANTVYYPVTGSITANTGTTSFAVALTSGAVNGASLTAATSIGGTWTAGPVATQTDPNKTKTAATRVRTGVGALANPSFSNRGSNNTTATSSATGDGYADLYQASNFINVNNLYSSPTAGANVQFGSITGNNQWYKLVQVTNVTGSAGAYNATFQINPALSVLLAPANGDTITTRLKYSQVRLTGHDFLYIGTGNQPTTNYPNVNISTAITANQQASNGGGRVFFTSTDQDGNFNVGNLFSVAQATGVASLNASAFNLSGLQSLSLGSVTVGSGSATITQFSTDPYFTANSDTILPTQRAIRSYITSQIGGGQSQLNVNTLTAGTVKILNNTITTTTGGQIQINAKLYFNGVNGNSTVDGAPMALMFFMQR